MGFYCQKLLAINFMQIIKTPLLKNDMWMCDKREGMLHQSMFQHAREI
jgi:hypothetical protein